MVETIFTIGHSTRPIDEFIHLLHAHGVKRIIDVRTIAKSRHNPQFGEDLLGPSLAAQDIGYQRLEILGGLRHTDPHSINGAWRNASFRGYADYMQTDAFAAGIAELIELGRHESVAIMCAEAVPWRCHRSLIGDALLVRDIRVLDIMSEKDPRPHSITRFAHVDGLQVTYPKDADQPEVAAEPEKKAGVKKKAGTKKKPAADKKTAGADKKTGTRKNAGTTQISKTDEGSHNP
ncbi:MAG: DUF488 domain-containing protein [Lacisediminihabitans sp.]